MHDTTTITGTTVAEGIRLADVRNLSDQLISFQQGELPELGKPHPKAGYRLYEGKRRFNLGHNKLLAQWRARSLTMAWASIVGTGGNEWTKTAVDAALEQAKKFHDMAMKYLSAQNQVFHQIAAGSGLTTGLRLAYDLRGPPPT